MDHARIALATLATIGTGIALGLAANPTMRPMPEQDWRARYRASNPAPPPAPQPGVSYFGDGSTAWAGGGAPTRVTADPSPERSPEWRDEPERWTPPATPPDYPRDDFDADASAAERAVAQATVSRALVRSEPRVATPADHGAAPDEAPQAPPAGEPKIVVIGN